MANVRNGQRNYPSSLGSILFLSTPTYQILPRLEWGFLQKTSPTHYTGKVDLGLCKRRYSAFQDFNSLPYQPQSKTTLPPSSSYQASAKSTMDRPGTDSRLSTPLRCADFRLFESIPKLTSTSDYVPWVISLKIALDAYDRDSFDFLTGTEPRPTEGDDDAAYITASVRWEDKSIHLLPILNSTVHSSIKKFMLGGKVLDSLDIFTAFQNLKKKFAPAPFSLDGL